MEPQENLLIATWQHAEHLACGHMIELGFADAEVTPSGNDGGVDVRATGGIAQVKHFTSSVVGAPAVQQLIGAAVGSVHGLFYALAGYSNAAVLLANKHNVALFQYNLLGHVESRSDTAERLQSFGFAPWDPEVITSARTEFMVALTRYGQAVADSVDAITPSLLPTLTARYEDLRDAGRIDEARALLATVQIEMNAVVALLEPLNGEKVHVLTDFLRDVTRAEALMVQVANRVSLDHAALVESARQARSGAAPE